MAEKKACEILEVKTLGKQRFGQLQTCRKCNITDFTDRSCEGGPKTGVTIFCFLCFSVQISFNRIVYRQFFLCTELLFKKLPFRITFVFICITQSFSGVYGNIT